MKNENKFMHRESYPLRYAIAGMGGFASCHHQAMLQLEASGDAVLVATCDPQSGAFEKQRQEWGFASRGVEVFDDYITMLDACAGRLDALIVPTPISLHGPMHAEALKRGIAVYLEKPPTLDPDELEAMIDGDKSARHATAVGFNLINDKTRQSLKARLLAGEFGAIESLAMMGWWPRASSYFTRNNWAGRLKTADGRLLLDSCFSNAMAHYVHNTLFWAGKGGLLDWAYPDHVRARLFRTHAIEGADTFLVEADTGSGVPLRIAVTHACADVDATFEKIVTEQAVINYFNGSHYEIEWNDGRQSRHPFAQSNVIEDLADSVRSYCNYLYGKVARPLTLLSDCRPFVHLNALAYISSAEVIALPGTLVCVNNAADKKVYDFFEVSGLRQAIERFLENGSWPEYDGNELVAGGEIPRTVTALALPQLNATIDRIRQECGSVRA